MVRVLKRQDDGKLRVDPSFEVSSRSAAAPSPAADAQGKAFRAAVDAIADRNRQALTTLTDPGLRRSVIRSLRGG